MFRYYFYSAPNEAQIVLRGNPAASSPPSYEIMVGARMNKLSQSQVMAALSFGQHRPEGTYVQRQFCIFQFCSKIASEMQRLLKRFGASSVREAWALLASGFIHGA